MDTEEKNYDLLLEQLQRQETLLVDNLKQVRGQISDVKKARKQAQRSRKAAAKSTPKVKVEAGKVNQNGSAAAEDADEALGVIYYEADSSPKLERGKYPRTGKTRRQAWEDNFNKLLEFRETNGHCNVTQTPKTQLSNWVKNQRFAYNNKTLSADYVEKLDDIGFVWRRNENPVISWEEKFAKLEQFVDEHGNCNVPRNDRELGRWVAEQRTQHKLKQSGKKCALTDERIEKLEGVGFEWDATANRGGPGKKRKRDPGGSPAPGKSARGRSPKKEEEEKTDEGTNNDEDDREEGKKSSGNQQSASEATAQAKTDECTDRDEEGEKMTEV